MATSEDYHTIPTPSGLIAHFVGPSKEAGSLPALFYFCGSAEESLTVPPLNLPVKYLYGQQVRIFSFTLPFHGPGYPHTQAINHWADELRQGHDPLSPFFDQAQESLSFLTREGWLDPGQIGVAGLSRGAFIALHLAARVPTIKTVLGLAPMTNLHELDSFRSLKTNKLVDQLSLTQQLDLLATRTHRYYVGNRDLRIGTEACFHWVRQLTERAYQLGIRSPPVELIISPSIGHKGHGTSEAIFLQSADWLQKELRLKAI